MVTHPRPRPIAITLVLVVAGMGGLHEPLASQQRAPDGGMVCPVPAPRAAGGAAASRPAGGAGARTQGDRGGRQPPVVATPAFPGPIFDVSMGPGENFQNGDFRLWYPEDLTTIRAVLVLTPGSNGDGRNAVADSVWEAFAIANDLALVGVSLSDKAPRSIFENYVDVARGSGDAFLYAMNSFARQAEHPELATAPFLLWGMSAGGEFNYEMTLWKPERVVAFVVNKGGIYWHALASPAARAVPGILFTGGADLDSRIGTIFGLFALNRRGGALWSYSEEPCIGHAVGRSQELALMFFHDMLAARLDGAPVNPEGMPILNTLTEESGLIGNITDFTYGPAGETSNTSVTTSWFPNERIARGWQAIATGQPTP